jgi:hypothetical protein
LSSNGTKDKIQSKMLSPHKPSNQKRKRRQHINKRGNHRGEEIIRKEVVSCDKIQRFLLTVFPSQLAKIGLIPVNEISSL